jgi:hypothetical protein
VYIKYELSNAFLSNVSHYSGNAWYGSGLYGTNDLFGTPILIKSIDDGLTWDVGNKKNINGGFMTFIDNANARQSFITKYHKPTNTFLAGGSNIAYSTNFGTTWNLSVSEGEFDKVNAISMGGPVWIIGVSDIGFSSLSINAIKYSIDNGINWTDSDSNANGGYSYACYEVAYSSNVWIATGLDYVNDDSLPYTKSYLKYSTDGINWSNVNQNIFIKNNFAPPSNIEIGPIQYDSVNSIWNIFVGSDVYSHNLTDSFASNWTKTYTSSIEITGLSKFTTPVYVDPKNARSILTFPSTVRSGPTFTSPTKTEYAYYQYLKIDPITVSATGTGIVYLFVRNEDLPQGIDFDPVTGILSGTPTLGNKTSTITVYAKDNIGVSILTMTMAVILPFVVKQQIGAAAYTSLVRQNVEINAAQNSRDNKVYPVGEGNLGKLMSPEAPDEISDRPCPC